MIIEARGRKSPVNDNKSSEYVRGRGWFVTVKVHNWTWRKGENLVLSQAFHCKIAVEPKQRNTTDAINRNEIKSWHKAVFTQLLVLSVKLAFESCEKRLWVLPFVPIPCMGDITNKAECGKYEKSKPFSALQSKSQTNMAVAYRAQIWNQRKYCSCISADKTN